MYISGVVIYSFGTCGVRQGMICSWNKIDRNRAVSWNSSRCERNMIWFLLITMFILPNDWNLLIFRCDMDRFTNNLRWIWARNWRQQLIVDLTIMPKHKLTTLYRPVSRQYASLTRHLKNNRVESKLVEIMPECQAFGCNNHQGEKERGGGEGKSFFIVPNPRKNPEVKHLAEMWLHKIGTGLFYVSLGLLT